MGLVECVPNFSAGRDRVVIDALAQAVKSRDAVSLLDVQADPDHNRCVLTFVGPAQEALEAALAATRVATGLIEMEKHSGSHPRIGATDVVPFVPVAGTSLDECVLLARQLGARIAAELDIPVYLYGAAAVRPGRVNLADIRRGQYEALKGEIALPERMPDFGPSRMHPTAGATVVGARLPMVAFNVYLGGLGVSEAKGIARAVRERSGGLPRVQAIGLEVAGGQVQVSMNLLDTRTTSIWKAAAEVRRLAEQAGGHVTRTEVVGLVTLEAVASALTEALNCPGLSDQVLEARLARDPAGLRP
ncbi:MAG: glutamate formimidoyltransferase [Bacillota bacterium]|nr:glutamate formimidoyltransferase [Bacillota bacterium]